MAELSLSLRVVDRTAQTWTRGTNNNSSGIGRRDTFYRYVGRSSREDLYEQ